MSQLFSSICMIHASIRTCLSKVLILLLLTTLLLGGCVAAGPEPTPTPTKTPATGENSGNTAGEPEVATAPAEQPVATPIPTDTPAPALSPTPLPRAENIAPYTGLPVTDPTVLDRRPVFICINNDPVGRSAHAGLSLADLVYEYIVDGLTTTRITAMYQSQDANPVGPVRSARFPNIWMTYMYDGALACSGGSDAIRYLLKNEVGFPYLDADIDDPSNSVYFINLGGDYRTRLQVSTDGVRRWLADNGLIKSDWNRAGFVFDDETPPNPVASATVINIAYPGGNSVEWRYDATQNGYIRFQGGQQQVDPTTGKPIVAQNVIAIAAEHEITDIVEDSLGTKSVDVKLYGFGDLRVFRDGQVYEGTWRADPENPPKWLGPGDVTIPLRPGQSWVQVVRDKSELSY